RRASRFLQANPEQAAVLSHAAHDSYSAIVDDESALLDEDATWLRDQRRHHKSLHWLRRPSVVMMGTVIFLIAFATASAEGTRQMIQLRLACNSVKARTQQDVCDAGQTQVLVLSLQQAYSVARGVAVMVALGKVGPLSDRHGRKVFLVAALLCAAAGLLAKYTLMALYATLPARLLVAVELVLNCAGGSLAVLTLANCYVSDIAEAHQRTYYMGINVACFFAGMSTGPVAGNAVLAFFRRHAPAASQPAATYGPGLGGADFAPLRLELWLFFGILAFAVFVLPESRGAAARRMSRSLSLALLKALLRAAAPPRRRDAVCRSLNFLRPVRLVFYPRDSVHRLRHRAIARTRVAVLLLVVAECLITSFGAAMGEVYILYGVYRFQWAASDIGRLMAVTCLGRAVMLVVVSPVLTRNVCQGRLGLRPNRRRFDKIDFAVVVLAFACECAGHLGLGAARSGAVFLGCLVFNSVSCVAAPALNSAIIKFYPEAKIGEVFGGIAIVKNVFSIVCPVAILALYKTALSRWNYPQVIFLVLAGVFA
ncbi:hypothetical protein METBIDRAFT_19161, partial [Metschnikowia bicuspidata var. bicuspidata NRRL YB-4993]